MADREGKGNTVLIALDVVAFALLFVGAALIRFSKVELTSIVGGFVLAGAVAILSITRYIQK